ncbi:hypothetical protein [Saccharicrinis sp. GN24d3]
MGQKELAALKQLSVLSSFSTSGFQAALLISESVLGGYRKDARLQKK